MGDEGSGEVGRIDGNDTCPRPQQGKGSGDGVAVGARLESDEDRRVRHVVIPQHQAQGRPMAALRYQCGPNPRPAPGPFGPQNRHAGAGFAVDPRFPWRRSWLVWEGASLRPAIAGFLAGLRAGRYWLTETSPELLSNSLDAVSHVSVHDQRQEPHRAETTAPWRGRAPTPRRGLSPSACAGGAAAGSHISSPGCTDRHSAGVGSDAVRGRPRPAGSNIGPTTARRSASPVVHHSRESKREP
jgi:hypothetical protein